MARLNVLNSPSVSRETGIYERLLEWAVWATHRRNILDRHDEISNGFKVTEEIRTRMRAGIRLDLTPEFERIERAVGFLGLEHDDKRLQFLVKQYFLEWKTIETIALEQNLSEFQVEADLRRALLKLSRRLAIWA